MKITLKEPISARYLHVSPENIVHVIMPIVSGMDIGLDIACQAALSLQKFFGKGSYSNEKVDLKATLLIYEEALEYDICLLGEESALGQQKKERLTQIKAYLKALLKLKLHPEFNGLNSRFPSYPRPVVEFMNEREHSNLYRMVLRPSNQVDYLRSGAAANPLFSLTHKSASREIDSSQSNLQQALIEAYGPLNFKTRDLKSQVMKQVLAQLQPPYVPVNFECLRQTLQNTVRVLMNVDVDFTKDQHGNRVTQEIIDSVKKLEPHTAEPKKYIEALLRLCAANLFEPIIQSPFHYLTQAKQWSIATLFFLGITNVYCVTHDLIHSNTNFGQILDNSLDLSTDLAQILAQAQKTNVPIEEACLSWINEHFKRFQLKTPLTAEDIHAIKHDFASRYMQIKDSPHFDEFFVLDPKKKGHFVTHQGSICMNFAALVCSPLLHVPEKLTHPLEKARTQANSLGVNIPHINPLVQDDVTIDTATMDNTALQALCKRIVNCQNSKLREELLVKLKQACPLPAHTMQFLQYVAFGQQNMAEELLYRNKALAQVLLTARDMEFTDYSGRTFKCSAYEYAWWAKDSHMRFMLECYMDDDTKKELLTRVQHIEELIGAGLFKEPRGLAYTQNGKEYRSAHFDLTPLKQALITYIETDEKNPKITAADWEKLHTAWIQVGLPQKEVPAHVAQEYCHCGVSFKEVIRKPDVLLSAFSQNQLERHLKIHKFHTGSDGAWFDPSSPPERSELGRSYAIVRSGSWRAEACAAAVSVECARVDLEAIEVLDETRTEDLKRSIERLAIPSSCCRKTTFALEAM